MYDKPTEKNKTKLTGFQLAGAVLAALLLVVGGEKRGISRKILDASDAVVRVDYGREFRGSLSSSAACAVMVLRHVLNSVSCRPFLSKTR